MTNDFLNRANDEINRLEDQDKAFAQEERRIIEQRELLSEQLVRIRTAADIYRQLMEMPAPPESSPQENEQERSTPGSYFSPET